MTMNLFAEPKRELTLADWEEEQDDAAGLRYYQRDACEAVKDILIRGVKPACFDALNPGYEGTLPARSTMVELFTGGGKCLGRGTPVMLWDGRIVGVENVKLGDRLMGPDSKPRRVLSVTQGHGPLRRIVPERGLPWVCNDVHVLTLRSLHDGSLVDIPVNEYEKRSVNFKLTHLQTQVGVEFPGKPTLPFPAYVMGLFVVDGMTDSAGRLVFCSSRNEVRDEVVAMVRKLGISVALKQAPNGRPGWHLTGKNAAGFSERFLAALPVSTSLEIPPAYLRASRAERLELLAGIVDGAAGVYDSHRYVIRCVEYGASFCADLLYLARSLGLTAEMGPNGLEVWGDTRVIPTRIRSAAPVLGTDVTKFRVEDAGQGEFFGFELEGDGRFLLGDFTVTHNTQIFSATTKEWLDLVRSVSASSPGRVLVLAHREELVKQAAKRLEQITGELVEVEKAEKRAWMGARIVVASIQTLMKKARLERFPRDHFSLIIHDEAHHYVTKNYRRPAEWFDQAKLLYVTATPDRGDGKAMGKVCETVAYKMDINDGIKEGFLVPIDAEEVVIQKVDLSGVEKTKDGDLNQAQLDEAMLKGAEGICQELYKRVPNEHTVLFTPGVKMAHYCAAKLNEYRPGCAAAVDGTTEEFERKRILQDFAEGRINFVCNCAILTEGFDAPITNVVARANPTMSRSRYAQETGRGTRVLPGIVDDVQLKDQAETRRRLIAASTKPVMLLLEFTGDGSKHSLVGPEDILGGDYSDAEKKQAKKVRKETGETDVQRSLAEARRQLAAIAKAMDAKVEATSRKFDPFTTIAVHEAHEHKYRLQHGYQAMTEGQLQALREMGLTTKELEGKSKHEAFVMLKRAAEHRKRGLASLKQLRTLQKYGVGDEKTSARRASSGIEYLVSCGWDSRRIDANRLATLVGTGQPRQPVEEW